MFYALQEAKPQTAMKLVVSAPTSASSAATSSASAPTR